MIELFSDEKVVKMVSTTTYQVALIEDRYGFFICFEKNGEITYGRPFRDYRTASIIFEDIQQELSGN